MKFSSLNSYFKDILDNFCAEVIEGDEANRH